MVKLITRCFYKQIGNISATTGMEDQENAEQSRMEYNKQFKQSNGKPSEGKQWCPKKDFVNLILKTIFLKSGPLT